MDTFMHYIKQPSQTDSDWFRGQVADTFQSSSPNYITIISFICAIGCLHNFLSSNRNDPHSSYRLNRLYSSFAQIIVTCMSFMSIIDRPHLQQILSSGLLLAFNICQLAPTALQNIIPTGAVENLQQFVQKQQHAWDQHDDEEKSQHQRSNQPQQKPNTLFGQQQQEQQQQQKSNNHKSNDLSSTTRLILTWCKNAFLTYLAALPALAANHTHINRKKWSMFNPFSWFGMTSNEYWLFNPMSLSLINMCGVVMATWAIIQSIQPQWYANSIVGRTMNKVLPSYWNTMATYSVFSCGVWLTAFSFTRPLTWTTTITPIACAFFTCVKWALDYQKNNKTIPSLIHKIDQSSWGKQAIQFGEKLLPCQSV